MNEQDYYQNTASINSADQRNCEYYPISSGGIVPQTQTITTVPNSGGYIWHNGQTIKFEYQQQQQISPNIAPLPSLTEQVLLKRIEELERRLGIKELELQDELMEKLENETYELYDPEAEDKEPKPSRKFRKVTEETI